MKPPRPRVRKGGPTVPAQPFADWLNHRYDAYLAEITGGEGDDPRNNNGLAGPSARLAAEIGFSDGTPEAGVRRLYRYKNMVTETARGKTADGKKSRVVMAVTEYSRDVVRDALDRVDPDLFYELYPGLAHERDIELEPDAYCPFCKELVTPIDGLCPWCVCEHGHLFREVGITDDGFACLACAKEEDRRKLRVYRDRATKRQEAEAA